jgi:predicted NodU family carbamoyl transferase
MAEKDLNKEVEKLEKLVSKDAVITIAGYSFTPAKLMIAFGIVSSVLGGLYGAFETYKGYQDMKMKIEKYVAPDLSEFDKRLAMVEETSTKTNDYTRDIKNDIKNDIRRLETVVEQVERSQKQSQRETDQEVRQLRKEIDSKIQKALDNPLAGK